MFLICESSTTFWEELENNITSFFKNVKKGFKKLKNLLSGKDKVSEVLDKAHNINEIMPSIYKVPNLGSRINVTVEWIKILKDGLRFLFDYSKTPLQNKENLKSILLISHHLIKFYYSSQQSREFNVFFEALTTKMINNNKEISTQKIFSMLKKRVKGSLDKYIKYLDSLLKIAKELEVLFGDGNTEQIIINNINEKYPHIFHKYAQYVWFSSISVPQQVLKKIIKVKTVDEEMNESQKEIKNFIAEKLQKNDLLGYNEVIKKLSEEPDKGFLFNKKCNESITLFLIAYCKNEEDIDLYHMLHELDEMIREIFNVSLIQLMGKEIEAYPNIKRILQQLETPQIQNEEQTSAVQVKSN